MKKIELAQSGPQWHRWRKEGIGGSDACVVAGDVGWMSRQELQHNKLDLLKTEENAPMRTGHQLEPRARKLYELFFGRRMRPSCVEHDTYPWLPASLDGLSEDGQAVLEIKCPSIAAHLKALGGHFPDYKSQPQHQLLVTEAPLLHFWSYSDDEGLSWRDRCALVEMRPESEYQDWLFRREMKFMEELKEVQDLTACSKG